MSLDSKAVQTLHFTRKKLRTLAALVEPVPKSGDEEKRSGQGKLFFVNLALVSTVDRLPDQCPDLYCCEL